MRVVDWDKSEKGPQRRRTNDGRLLHCCCICGKLEPWSNRWTTYCSWRELDDEEAIPKFCSFPCREQAGPEATGVTPEMKRKAKELEWREPELVWREATDREKYDEAAHNQAHTRS